MQPAATSSLVQFAAFDPPRANLGSSWNGTTGAHARRYVASPGEADFMLEHDSNMPSASDLTTMQHDPLAEEIQSKLQFLAHRRDVSTEKATLVLSAFEFGIGATISALAMVVLDALARGHTLFMPPLRFWIDLKRCPRTDMSCFFDSLPSIETMREHVAKDANSTNHARRWRIVLDAMGGDGQVESVTRACKARSIPCPRMLKRTTALKLNESYVLHRLPKRWVQRGRFWLISQALRFLTQPNRELRALLDSARSALKRPAGPILGVQVRKGDACTHRGECRGLKHWMPAVQRMQRAYGFSSAFLSTPSEDVHTEADELQAKSTSLMQWLYVPDSTRTSTAMLEHKVLRIEDALRKPPGAFSPYAEWQWVESKLTPTSCQPPCPLCLRW